MRQWKYRALPMLISESYAPLRWSNPLVSDCTLFNEQGRQMSIPAHEESAIYYAVNHHGMVCVRKGARGYRLSWNARRMTGHAFVAVLDWLQRQTQDDVWFSLEYYFYGWIYENSLTHAAACRRFEDLQDFRSRTLTEYAFVRPLDISTIPNRGSLVADGLNAWRTSNRFSAHSDLNCVGDDVLIYDQRESDGEFKYRRFGKNAAILGLMGGAWGQSSIGMNCEAPSSPNAGSGVGLTYSEVLDDNQPRFGSVTASISRTGRDPVWVTYDRLLLPSLDQFGRPIVICLSQVQPVRIPFQA